MAKAKQLPSGSWRVQVYDGETKKYLSFTSKLPGKAGKAEAELMAREYQLGQKRKKEQGRTVGECIDEYIALKENILSPTTISGYRKYRKTSLAGLCDIYISELTQQDIQAHVNKLALTMSPKSIHNAHGLLSATLGVYAPELRLRTTLPKIPKKIKHIPEVEEVWKAVYNTEIELPCLLAMWCSLRMSEVRGLKKSDIVDGVITVERTIVNADNTHIEKDSTKTIESTRQIELPDYILSLVEALPEEQEYLTTIKDHALYMRFVRRLKKRGVQHMSFHDLRHLNASVMLMLGIPDKYAMERGGWSTTSTLKNVYQHTFSAERKAADKKINDYFNGVLDRISHEISHN